MAFGTSLFLFAVGAILTWGVDVWVSGLNLDAIGIILMVVGAVGFLISALFFESWAPFSSRSRHTTVVRDRYPERERVVERDTFV